MKVKISDFIAQFLVEQGIKYNFTVPGGGAMHLNSSLGHQKGLTNIFVQHEQAAAIAAEGYYRMSNELPLVCCTTGPGGTNTLTGVLGAWLDSIPMLVISGQVKWSTTVRSTGLAMRSYGDQDFDITKVVAPMTKYAEMIIRPETVKYHIQKAIYLATHGRPGPVWLDIPLNIQWGYIDTDELFDFDPTELENSNPRKPSEKTLDLIIEKIKVAKRPVIYSGVELRTNGAYESFKKMVAKLNVPVVTSFDGIDIMEQDDPLYAGRAGDIADRAGNWAVQNSDYLLVVGSRLGIRQVSYATETWAREAFVTMVYPDALETTKPNIHVELPVRADLKEFCDSMCDKIASPLEAKSDWISNCKKWMKDYPVVTSERHNIQKEAANVYWLIDQFNKFSHENTPIVTGNGSAAVVTGSALFIKKGQRYMFNTGCASMGWGLPASIGACFANGRKETYCITGDGSIQMNLQELQTLVFHKLPIKILLINNGGYHSMRQTQRNLFKETTAVGVGPETKDLSFPCMKKIAGAYGIPYLSATKNDELPAILKQFTEIDGYAMCEVFVDSAQGFEPKPSAMKLADGSLVSPPLEDLAPFLDRDELKKVMIIPLVGEN